MKRCLLLIVCWSFTLAVLAQTEDVPISAGKDFYFTVFDHSPNHKQTVVLQAQATQPSRMTIKVGKNVQQYTEEFGILVGRTIQPQPLEIVHVKTTKPCWLSCLVVGSKACAETAILPTHLLGTSYMLQGVPGSLVKIAGVPTPTYSQFSVIGTSDYTTLTIQSPIDLICVTNNRTIAAGSKVRFSISDEQVLLFQPVEYTNDITGVKVNANQPVAVFQGNNITRIPAGEDGSDYTWEQARPTTTWGTEFIIPKSELLQYNITKVTALEDNTEVYRWNNGTPILVTTLQSGESYSTPIDTYTPSLEAVHLQTSKPACCYLYFTGSSLNNKVGGPAMVEITPMDNPSTDTRWVMGQPSDGGPYQTRLLITMRADNQNNVLINNYPASKYSPSSVITDDYVTYDMAYNFYKAMRISATKGGFSAYTIHVGHTAQAAAFNLALPEKQDPPELCAEGGVLYLQNSVGSFSMYTQTLSGFCAGTSISFSALVSFPLSSPVKAAIIETNTNTEIAHYEKIVGEKDVDTQWHDGRQWIKVGVSCVVPYGMSELSFQISNGYNALIDSFEVRLCTPPVTILAPDTVCVDTKNIFSAEFENDGSFIEPLEYQWYFSADSAVWMPLADGQSRELKLKAKPRHSGWYKVAVAGAGNITNEKCRTMSAPHKFFVIEDCPPILCPEGILLMHQDYSSPVPFCETIIEDVCSSLDLSLIVNLPANHAETRLIFHLQDPSTGHELAAYDTGDVPPDSLQVGTTFMIPDGVNSLRWVISNNKVNSIGQPFAISNTEIRLCLEPISIQAASTACRKKPFTLQALYENYDILQQPEYQWYFSTDEAGEYKEINTGTTRTFTIPVVHKSHEGWYRVAVGEEGQIGYPNCRSISEPFHLLTRYCNTAVEQYFDTTACDTLLEYHLAWRGHEWPAVGTLTDTIPDFEDDDSVHVHLTLHTKICCPDIHTVRVDSAVCDSLLPFLWIFGDTMLLFEEPKVQNILRQHPRWENCIDSVYAFALDTFHCERLYPIIVNKYNWQLLLDIPTLRRFFPERRCLTYQWYKNGESIPGATQDDYAEKNELYGRYQLCIRLDEAVDNHDEYIWSDILEIGEQVAPLPVTKHIYNSSGIQIREDRMSRGIYLILYQQGDKFWTEKRLVP